MTQLVLQKTESIWKESLRRCLGIQRKGVITKKLTDIEDREQKIYIQIIGVLEKEKYTEQK